MIAIIGSTEDDILYFVNRMNVTSVEEIAHKNKVYVGDFARQRIVVTHTGQTMMMSSQIAGIILDKYHPYLVISVGAAHSIHPKLKLGDLFLAERVYLSQVDLSPISGKLRFGQVPGSSLFFHSEDMCLNIIEMHNNREANKKVVRGFVMSSNMMPRDLEEIRGIVKKFKQPLEEMIAVDTEVGGIAVACEFFDVPIVVLKATTYEVGNMEQFVARERVGIEMSPIVGNLIGHLLLDLASQEAMQ